MPFMAEPHPHSGATYRVIARKDGAFEIEVSIPAMSPITVTNFPTRRDADEWIARHEAAVAEGAPRRRSFRMPSKRH
jgi:hypothetical protein